MKKTVLLPIALIVIFAALSWLVIHTGQDLKPLATVSISSDSTSTQPVAIQYSGNLLEQVAQNIKSPLGLFLLQIITILAVSKLFGVLMNKLGQPSVVGEMIAGIFLGPSILGLLLPEASSFLFPKGSLTNLQFLSQIGLAFFMFIVGMELDLEKLKNKASSAVLISNTSVVFPFFLGVVAAYFLYERFAPAGVAFYAFALFIGIAVSITAFPVLARILQERNLTKTPLGVVAITCAAVDDVTAWCLLAIIIAVVKTGSIGSALFTIVLSILFVLAMFYVVRPIIARASGRYTGKKNINKTGVALVFIILLLSACITEAIGIHALFGAFVAGIIMPQKTDVRELLLEKIEDISTLLLLPIFFAITGLRTQIGLLNEGSLWLIFGFILLVAVGGKLGGSTVAARLSGYPWKEAFSIGALMNTRGLMELIVLNIGYDMGILSPALFAIMVLMAITTTLMTAPLLDLTLYLSKVEQNR